jgi:hypothetical protein
VAVVRFRRAIAIAGLLAVPGSTSAQSAPTLKLKPAAAKLDQEFSAIVAVRELSDGRALVADIRENKVVVVDFASGSVTQIGRSGQGPGEYQNPRWLHRLGGDSTLLVEQRTSRWHLVAGDKVVATLPPDNAAYMALRRQALGADGRGNVIATSSFADNQGAAIPANGPDSSWLVRTNRKTARIDTLGRLKAQKSTITTTTNAKGEVSGVSVFLVPYSAPGQAAMFEDGWIAIARVAPYRVDWIGPGGKVTKGAAIPWPVTKLGQRDVEFFFAARSSSVTSSMSAEQAEARRKQVETVMKHVPETVPPFATAGLIPAEDGTLIIRHSETASQPNARYDVVDRSGRLRGTIALDKGESIAAVSKKWAYVVYVDDDGLNFLRRHPWQSVSVVP